MGYDRGIKGGDNVVNEVLLIVGFLIPRIGNTKCLTRCVSDKIRMKYVATPWNIAVPVIDAVILASAEAAMSPIEMCDYLPALWFLDGREIIHSLEIKIVAILNTISLNHLPSSTEGYH